MFLVPNVTTAMTRALVYVSNCIVNGIVISDISLFNLFDVGMGLNANDKIIL